MSTDIEHILDSMLEIFIVDMLCIGIRLRLS